MKETLKYVIKDKTDLLMITAMIVISVLDFVTNLPLTGAPAFCTFYAMFAVYRVAYWKWRYTEK